MNPVLESIVESGRVVLPSGESVPVSSQIDPACGALLQKVVGHTRPRVVVEVGLAFGISSLYMLDALAQTGSGRLIGMDPAQFDSAWRGGGLHNIERAGYKALYEFLDGPSQHVLPQLVCRGERADAAFI